MGEEAAEEALEAVAAEEEEEEAAAEESLQVVCSHERSFLVHGGRIRCPRNCG